MIGSFEPAMNALFASLQAAVTRTFTANATSSSATLASVSNFTGLFVGLPVFGVGVPRNATIASINQGGGTITLSSPLTASGTGVTFTTGFMSTGRRLKHWTQVQAQPALFLRRTGTTDDYSGTLGITTIDCEVWIYCQAGKDPDLVPDVALSNLDMMVRASFAPDDDARFTLGRTVYWCRIEGHSDYSPGDQGGQGISRIPVRITLP